MENNVDPLQQAAKAAEAKATHEAAAAAEAHQVPVQQPEAQAAEG